MNGALQSFGIAMAHALTVILFLQLSVVFVRYKIHIDNHNCSIVQELKGNSKSSSKKQQRQLTSLNLLF